MVSETRADEVVKYAIANGDDSACEQFGVSAETLQRYKRRTDLTADLPAVLKRITERYSDKELAAIAKGAQLTDQALRVPNVHFDGDSVKIGVLTDTHIGSLYFQDSLLLQAFDVFDRESVDMVVHSGDVTEGLSHRAGHVYECTEIGYDAQLNKAIDLLAECPTSLYAIDGNHDRWFTKSAGALIVKDICEHVPQAEYLGQDEADIYLNDKIRLRLWHGEDSSSYATSYRVQKLVEAFAGGDKPHILVCGHTHKQGYFFERNIHCFSGGCIQMQSKWMRGKRIAAHVGFWIIEPCITDDSVPYVKSTWYPFYL